MNPARHPFHRLALGMLLLGSLLVRAVAAQNASSIPDPDPEVERRGFKIADGFEINLWASDPMVEKPIQMNWDARGRLWCATSATYPQIKPGQTPNDKIYILEDTTGAGRADKSTVFADGLFISNSVIPGDGGAYVTNSTELLHLTGTNKDDVRRRVVLAGFGTEDTHHIVHTLHWGPDGKLYFFQSIYIHSHLETPRGLRTLLGSGCWRLDTRTLDLGVYSRGLVNPWGIIWDRWGQTFETDGAGGEGINYAFPGAAFTSAAGIEKIMPGLNPGSPKYAGEEILSGRALPDDYQGDILTNDFRANRIVRFKLAENGAGFTSKQMPDFLTCADQAFRPVDIKMGPDGAIYICDWYNPIIQHGEVDFRDPRRDHVHGRIWRITAKEHPPLQKPTIDGASIRDLLSLLAAPEDFTRMQARLAMRERDPRDVLPALRNWVRNLKSDDPQADHDRLEALWTCEGLDAPEPSLLARVLKSEDPRARAAACRVLGHWADQLPDATNLLERMIADEHPRVRLEAVRALAMIPAPQSIVLATRVLVRPMDASLDYALWLTCNDLAPVWLPAFQAGKLTDWGKADHLNYALGAVKSPAGLKTLVEQLKTGQTPANARAGVIDLIGNLGGADEADALLDVAVADASNDPADAAHLLAALDQLDARRHARPSHHLGRLMALIDNAHESVRVTALRLAGRWKLNDAEPQLIRSAESPKTDDAERRAAMDGLATLGTPTAIKTLKRLATPPAADPVRRQAIAALAAVDLQDAAARAADMLHAGDADPGTILDGFATHDGGPAALAEALKGNGLPRDTARLCLRFLRSATSQDPALMAILNVAAGASAEPIRLTADQMRKTIDEVQSKGNAARGEQVFRRADVGCYQCHALAGAGGWLAPDLTSIGATSPIDYLVDSVLDPNKAIKDGYQGYTIITRSGDAYSGIKVRQDNAQVVLRDNLHAEIPIALADIKAQKDVGSLMPNGLADFLTHQEFLDLIKFLSELGKPGSYGPSTTQIIRRWRVLDPAPPLDSSTDIPASLDRQAWEPAYSLVSGELPPDAFKNNSTAALARGEIDVQSPGKIRLLFNDVQGLSLWVDQRPVKPLAELVLDLPRGTHSLTMLLDRRARGTTGLRVEVADANGSAGHAQAIGGR